MPAPISRRAFTLGGLATALGGSAVVSLPGARVIAAQSTDLTSLGLPTLDLTITASAFEGMPAETEAGRYLVTLTAEGVDGGSAGFIQPPAGMSAEDFLTMLGLGGGATPEASPPDVTGSPAAEEGGEEEAELLPTFVYQTHFAGGTSTNADTPGQVVLDLGPGDWILWGDGPESPQAPVTFTVTGDMPADLIEPDADIMVTFIDFAISLDGALTAGDHTLRIENQGAQPHFLILLAGPDTMTAEAVEQLLQADMSGPSATPPDVGFDPDRDLVPVLATGTQSIGTTTWINASLEPSKYLAACFFPTAGEGLPHAYHGMFEVFTVS